MNFSITYKANVITKDNECEIHNGKMQLTCNVTKEDLITEKYSKQLEELLIDAINKNNNEIEVKDIEIVSMEESLNQGYEFEQAIRYLRLCNDEEKKSKKDLKNCEDRLKKAKRELVNLENKVKKEEGV